MKKQKMTLGNETARRFSLIPCSSLLEIVFKSGDNVIFRGFRGISDNNISVGTQSANYLNRNMKLIHISVSLCEIDGQRWLKVLQGTGQTEGQVDFNILHPSNVEDVISFIVLWLFLLSLEGWFFLIYFFPCQLYLNFIIIHFVIVFHKLERQLHYSSTQCLTVSSCSLLARLQLTIVTMVESIITEMPLHLYVRKATFDILKKWPEMSHLYINLSRIHIKTFSHKVPFRVAKKTQPLLTLRLCHRYIGKLYNREDERIDNRMFLLRSKNSNITGKSCSLTRRIQKDDVVKLEQCSEMKVDERTPFSWWQQLEFSLLGETVGKLRKPWRQPCRRFCQLMFKPVSFSAVIQSPWCILKQKKQKPHQLTILSIAVSQCGHSHF